MKAPYAGMVACAVFTIWSLVVLPIMVSHILKAIPKKLTVIPLRFLISKTILVIVWIAPNPDKVAIPKRR